MRKWTIEALAPPLIVLDSIHRDIHVFSKPIDVDCSCRVFDRHTGALKRSIILQIDRYVANVAIHQNNIFLVTLGNIAVFSYESGKSKGNLQLFERISSPGVLQEYCGYMDPRGLAFTESGDVIISSTNVIHIYRPFPIGNDDEKIYEFIIGWRINSLGWISDIVLYENEIYAVTSGGTVEIYSLSGEIRKVLNEHIYNDAAKLSVSPFGIALSSTMQTHVSIYSLCGDHMFDIHTPGAYRSQMRPEGYISPEEFGELEGCRGIAFTSDGELIVASRNYIHVFC